MASFQYEALKRDDNSRVSGTIEADTDEQAVILLNGQDLIPTRLTLVKGRTEIRQQPIGRPVMLGSLPERIQNWSSPGYNERLSFTYNLGAMLTGGIPLLDALQRLSARTRNPGWKQVQLQIAKDLSTGGTLADALAKHPSCFNEVYVRLVEVAERSGKLDVCFQRLTEMMKRAHQISIGLILAAVYPCFALFSVLVLATVFLFVVMPTVAGALGSSNLALPLPLKIMLTVRNFWFVPVLAIGGLVAGYGLLSRLPVGKAILDEGVLYIPFLNDLIEAVQIGHFLASLHAAFGAGISVTEAVPLSARAMTNQSLRETFGEAGQQLEAGEPLTAALASTGYVPDTVLDLIETGETSGKLEAALQESLSYLEELVKDRVNVLIAVLQPVMIVLLMGVLGIFILTFFTTIFSAVGTALQSAFSGIPK